MKIADHPATADTTADDQKVKKSENKTKMEQIGIKVEEKLEEPVPSPSSQDVDLKNVDLDDLYSKYKKLHQQLEFLQVQEEYIKVG